MFFRSGFTEAIFALVNIVEARQSEVYDVKY
jgi:hypothetical protein